MSAHKLCQLYGVAQLSASSSAVTSGLLSESGCTRADIISGYKQPCIVMPPQSSRPATRRTQVEFAPSVSFSHKRKLRPAMEPEMPMSPSLVVGIQVVDSVLLCCDCQTTVTDCHCCCSNIGTLCVDCQSRRYGRSGRQHQRPHPLNTVMPLSDAPDIAMFKSIA